MVRDGGSCLVWFLRSKLLVPLFPAITVSLAIIGGPLTSPLSAQTPRLGEETQINAATTGFQFVPVVADNGGGGRVVVWMSEFAPEDGSGYAIRGRRVGPGNAMASEFQVNGVTTGDQRWPAVTMGADGAFVVVWASPGDGDGDSIQARRFASDGSPQGDQFQVNELTTGGQSYPDIVGRSDGSFVVVWSSLGSPADDQGTYSILARRFASDGNALGGSFQVNSYTTGDQTQPEVRWLDDDAFVVVWTSRGSGSGDTSDESVQGRRFAADGTPQSGDVQINTYTTGRQQLAAVATSDQGFMVVWPSVGSPGDDNDASSIQGRSFSSDLVPLGDQFQINSYTSSFQISTSVASLKDGGFVTVWESLGSVGDDTFDRSIQGQELDLMGMPIGSQFQINTFNNSYQLLPRVASDRRDGDYFVVWNSSGSFGDDQDATSVQGQRFGRRMFADGFETGDVAAWSSSAP